MFPLSERSATFQREIANFYKENNSRTSWANRFHKEITCRVGHAAAGICAFSAGMVDLGIGTIFSATSILTLGYFKTLNFRARNLTREGGKNVLSQTYQNVLGIIRPRTIVQQKFSRVEGIITPQFSQIGYCANWLSTCKNPIANHVLSRISYVGATLLILAARVVDLAIGIVAALTSILFLGYWKTANNYATRGLTFPLVINDAWEGARKTINPWIK